MKGTMLMALVLVSIAGVATEFSTLDSVGDSAAYVVHDSATVISDPENAIPVGNGVHALGHYKFAFSGSVAAMSSKVGHADVGLVLVEHRPTGQVGLSSGVVHVKHVLGSSSAAIASDYGIEIIGELPKIRRFSYQLSSLHRFAEHREELLDDPRIELVELDVSYAPVRAQ